MGQGSIHIINGPNLDLPGVREPTIYGQAILADVQAACRRELDGSGVAFIFRQPNALAGHHLLNLSLGQNAA